MLSRLSRADIYTDPSPHVVIQDTLDLEVYALDAGGIATRTMTAAASQTITAAYDGDTSFMTSSNSVALAVLSTDATLSALVPSAGSLEPGFSSCTIAYEVDVANETEAIRFTPTAASPARTYR